MALFGKKKSSLEEIMKEIEALSEEEKNELVSKLQGHPEETNPAEEENETTEETEQGSAEPTAEQSAEQEREAPGPTEESVGEEQSTEEPVETTEPMPETQQGGNYDEILAAQNARFDSIESQLVALKETVEKVVANQDNKNFGYSPKANFDDDIQASRSDAILQGYAPRRAEQYK